ncbi:MAG: DUF4062 domain-containing protein, partial [Anaerolinea sp.]|nr:DUF4062 domain-containing protein [Anaerolinea sp.]
MAAERDALHDRVYPRLQALCQAHGAVFQPIDLRWGISDEAGRDQRTVEICLSEVQRCQHLTRRPNFILLLGDRYGWQSLPSTIPENEFTQIIAEIDTLKDRELLQQWYRLDENAVPPHLILQPRTSEFAKYERWNIVESQVHQLLEEATTQFAWEQRRKY